MKTLTELFVAALFWGFIVIKWIGVSFAAWSWWWVFLPIVPWIGLAVERFKL